MLLGGVSIFGGKGSIIGVVLAVVVYAALQNALFLTNFPQRAFGIVTGCLLLLSVLVPNAGSFARRARPPSADASPQSPCGGGFGGWMDEGVTKRYQRGLVLIRERRSESSKGLIS